MTSEIKETEEYLLSLNVAAKKYNINYSLELQKKFNPEKCGWIAYRRIHKWNTSARAKLETHIVMDNQDMINYITEQFALLEDEQRKLEAYIERKEQAKLEKKNKQNK